MKKKHIAIKIMPRALLVSEVLALFITHYIIGRGPIHDGKDNIIGTLIILFGIILLAWTLRYVKKAVFANDLIITGPYKYIRHPMYVAIYIILFGIGILFFSWIWFIILVMFIPLWYANCKLEEKQMVGLYGDKYRKYKQRTGMFFPKINFSKR